MGKNQKRGSGERANGRQSPDTLGLADDALFRVLAARPRRRLLHYVTAVEETTASELATVLAGWDQVEEGGMVTETEHARIETALRHSHLPALAEAGLLTYDADTGHVASEPLDDAVADLLARSISAETE